MYTLYILHFQGDDQRFPWRQKIAVKSVSRVEYIGDEGSGGERCEQVSGVWLNVSFANTMSAEESTYGAEGI